MTKAVLRVAQLLEFNDKMLSSILGVSESSVHRLGTGQREILSDSKEGEFAALLVRLFRSLDVLVGGDAELRKRWLESHNRALNAVPLALLSSAQGLVNAVAYLDASRAPL